MVTAWLRRRAGLILEQTESDGVKGKEGKRERESPVNENMAVCVSQNLQLQQLPGLEDRDGGGGEGEAEGNGSDPRRPESGTRFTRLSV